MSELQQFLAERNEALESLDETRIRDFHRRWNGKDMPDDPIVFWGSIHKAITCIKSLPLELRQASKRYLDEHHLRSHDDGDLT